MRSNDAAIYTATRSIISQALRLQMGLIGEAVLFGRVFYMHGETFGWLFLDIGGQSMRMPGLRLRASSSGRLHAFVARKSPRGGRRYE